MSVVAGRNFSVAFAMTNCHAGHYKAANQAISWFLLVTQWPLLVGTFMHAASQYVAVQRLRRSGKTTTAMLGAMPRIGVVCGSRRDLKTVRVEIQSKRQLPGIAFIVVDHGVPVIRTDRPHHDVGNTQRRQLPVQSVAKRARP
jgi:hypothetical protein